MRTSLDVYNRIIWDDRYQKENYSIGYRNFQKIVEVKLVNWNAIQKGGDIPWHRVEYIKDGDRVIWHKTKKIDLLFDTGDNQEVIEEKGLKSFANILLKPQMRNCNGWETVETYSTNHELDDFKVITWNILCDTFNNVNHEERYQNICDIIKNHDIICLQEVTRRFLNVLNGQEWINEYWISDWEGHTFENGMGVMIISKISPKQVYMLCDTKNAIICEFLISGYNLKIVNFHLTSDYHGSAKDRRKIMLNRIYNLVRNDANCIWMILGDFNAKMDELRKSALWLTEWDQAYTGDTFCPTMNPLAKANSKRIEDRQIDYIFITKSNMWHLLDKKVINKDYSDHYGISCRIELFTGIISNDTCIVLTPPLKYWHLLLGKKWIEMSGKSGDFSLLKKWVPHVSIMLGYFAIDSESFDLDVLKSTFKPFHLKFDQWETFKNNPVLVSNNMEIRNLEKRLRIICPTASRGLFEGDYTPHITVPDKFNEVIEWKVDRMFVDVKKGSYFEHARVMGEMEGFDVDEFMNSIKKIFPTIKFQVIGSRYYLNDTTSDLDIIAYGNITQDEFYDRFLWVSRGCGDFEHAYVTDSKMQVLKLFNRFIGHVDMQYLQTDEAWIDTCPLEWKVDYDNMETVPKSRILVLQDNIHYNKYLSQEQKDLINVIKKWAKRRRIYLNWVGYLSGISITVMVAYSRIKSLEEFITFFKDFDFERIAISEKGFKVKRDGASDKLMFISSPMHPYNLNVKSSQSSIKWIREEMKKFKDEPVNVNDMAFPHIKLNVDKLGIVEFGRLTGRIVNLIVHLEINYEVFVHVVLEEDYLYMFLHKDDNLKIDTALMIRDIREWFVRNEFYIEVPFYNSQHKKMKV